MIKFSLELTVVNLFRRNDDRGCVSWIGFAMGYRKRHRRSTASTAAATAVLPQATRTIDSDVGELAGHARSRRSVSYSLQLY